MIVRRFPSRFNLVTLLVLLLMIIIRPGQADAQVAGAMLKGAVTDPAGASVPKAQVSIIDVATGITHNITTDAAGTYAAANLRPGEDQVRVTVHTWPLMHARNKSVFDRIARRIDGRGTRPGFAQTARALESRELPDRGLFKQRAHSQRT